MKNNAIINLALIVIIGGYLFFFTSNLWIPHNASAKKQTPLNESVEWADRAITIERWDYCERSRLMEVYMDIKSNTYDGIYAYKYEAVDRSEDNLKVSAAVEEPEWLVLRISGISFPTILFCRNDCFFYSPLSPGRILRVVRGHLPKGRITSLLAAVVLRFLVLLSKDCSCCCLKFLSCINAYGKDCPNGVSASPCSLSYALIHVGRKSATTACSEL